jgi:hypothetical protein
MASVRSRCDESSCALGHVSDGRTPDDCLARKSCIIEKLTAIIREEDATSGRSSACHPNSSTEKRSPSSNRLYGWLVSVIFPWLQKDNGESAFASRGKQRL